MSTTKVPLRSEIPVEYTWDLESIYASPADWEAALAEPGDSPARLNLLIAWLAHAGDADWNAIKALLKPYAESSDTSTRYQFGEAMALRGDAEDVPVLLRLLADADTDVRISAANALLAIERK